MARPLERDPVLPGFTYKLKWQASDHAIYVTMNDIEREGRRRPFEIFINTKNLEHYAWTVALTRMISAVFRRGGDVTFVVEELKAVFDPQGGQWMGGRYVPSLLAAIGEVIEAHMIRIGFLTATEPRQGSKHGIVTPPAAMAAERPTGFGGGGGSVASPERLVPSGCATKMSEMPGRSVCSAGWLQRVLRLRLLDLRLTGLRSNRAMHRFSPCPNQHSCSGILTKSKRTGIFELE